jgi:hypothetical protein
VVDVLQMFSQNGREVTFFSFVRYESGLVAVVGATKAFEQVNS